MKQIRWFDRKFEFSSEQNTFPSILERLEGTPLRLGYKAATIQPDLLTLKPDSKWSIQENIGHLIDLEPIWQGRLEDILSGMEFLREADLENKKTHEANHNEKSLNDLLSEFDRLRGITADRLRSLSESDIFQYALHPRLKTPMRTLDLFLFVAEHDDHHLATITELNRALSS